MQAAPAGRLARTGLLIWRHPREFVAMAMATIATGWIFTNALFLQKGPHPAPIFAARPHTQQVPMAPPRPQALVPAPQAVPLTLPTPVAAPAAAPEQNKTQLVTSIQRELARRGYYDGTVDGVWGAHTDAAVRDFLQASGAKVPADANDALLRAITAAPAKRSAAPARTADPIAALISAPQRTSAPSPRVLAVQRALNDFAYGPVTPTGVDDAATRTAIERFERSRGMPITGQVSDQLVRELSSVVGRPLE